MGSSNLWKVGSFVCALTAIIATCFFSALGVAESGRYIGTAACGECHEDEHANYEKFSKKAHSGRSVQIMAGDLTEEELRECYTCHTTGYGREGGFVSFEETPEMANAGCEVCHGPGYDHVESGGDPELIKRDLEISDCESCHNAARVSAFDYKPLLYGGAH